jgi:hypothetical protein
MLEVVGLSWALIISYPYPYQTPPTVVYVENQAVCLKDSEHINNNIKNSIVTCIPVRADVAPNLSK